MSQALGATLVNVVIVIAVVSVGTVIVKIVKWTEVFVSRVGIAGRLVFCERSFLIRRSGRSDFLVIFAIASRNGRMDLCVLCRCGVTGRRVRVASRCVVATAFLLQGEWQPNGQKDGSDVCGCSQ